MRTLRLGRDGPEVSALGLGCMRMSAPAAMGHEDESVATIQAALDAGINFLDTGDFYAAGHNEMLIGRALRGRRREDAGLFEQRFDVGGHGGRSPVGRGL